MPSYQSSEGLRKVCFTCARATSPETRITTSVERRGARSVSLFASDLKRSVPCCASAALMGASASACAPRASPASSITQAARTKAVVTPMQNVENSVARKSTTIGRTLDLPLEASILKSPCTVADPLFGPCTVLKPPKRAPPGEEDGRLPKNCGRKMAMPRARGRVERECAIFNAHLFPLLYEEGIEPKVDHAPPHRHRRRRRRNPRQPRGRPQEARAPGE